MPRQLPALRRRRGRDRRPWRARQPAFDDRLAQRQGLGHGLDPELGSEHLLAASVLGQGCLTLSQPAVGAHGSPVRILAQGILLQQPQCHSKDSLVLPERLPRSHQPCQRIAIQALQPVALAQHPVVVETIQELAAIQRDGLLQR